MSFSFRSSRLAAVGLAGILAVGVIGVAGVALAGEPGDSSSADEGARKQRAIKLSIHSLLKDSGVTREEVQEGASAGLTLGEIIDEYGDISAEEAKANALAKLSEKLAQLVANGHIAQERADAFLAKAPDILDRLLGAVPGGHGGERPGVERALAIARNALGTVSEVTGLDVATVRERLTAGETVADIAGDQTQAVIDALVADANAAIDNAVAGGKLSPEQGEEAKAKTAAAIERFVNEGRPDRDGEDNGRRGMRGANPR
jgi:hypothetical protein